MARRVIVLAPATFMFVEVRVSTESAAKQSVLN